MSVLPPRPSQARAPRAVLTGLLVCAVGSSIAVTVPASSASAATRASTYALSAHGYSSTISASQVDLRSAPTAYSVLGCARKTGVTRTNKLTTAATTDAKVDGARTVQHGYTTRKHETVLTSTSTAAAVTLGSNTLGIRIVGLRSVAKTLATKGGGLHASSTFTFASIEPVGPVALPSVLNQSVSTILKSLAANGPLTIPGVGFIQLGGQTAGTTRTAARAGGVGLKVHLFGSDQINNTADDSDVTLVRTYARLSKVAKNGLFGGAAWGVDASAVGGLAAVGRNPYTPLGCEGTGGRVVRRSLAGLNLASTNQLVVDGMRNRVYGRQGTPSKGLTGWTENTIAGVNLGGALRVDAISARARAVRSSKGKITRTYSQHIGSITVNGTKHAVPSPGRSFSIPGVATIAVPKPVRTSNGIRVTALRITLLGGSAAHSVINLGNATASVRAH